MVSGFKRERRREIVSKKNYSTTQKLDSARRSKHNTLFLLFEILEKVTRHGGGCVNLIRDASDAVRKAHGGPA
jgi:hypothetical protein